MWGHILTWPFSLRSPRSNSGFLTMPTQTAPAAESTPSVSDALGALLDEEGVTPAVEETAGKTAATEADPPAEEVAAEVNAEPGDEPQADDQFAELAEEAVSHYGMSKDEVERAGDLLPWVLARMDKQASLLMQRDGAAEEQGQQPTQQPQQTPAAPKAEETRKPLGQLGKFELPINREDHDEGSLTIFDKLAEVINEQRETLNQHLEALQVMAPLLADTHQAASSLKQRTETHTATEFANSMDDFFAKLPEEYSDIYGNQPMAQLPKNSPLAAARNALVAEMTTLAEFDAKGGRPARAVQQQAARTLRALHADKEHKVARREADALVQKQRARAIARPSGRGKPKGDDLDSRRERAMTAIDKIKPLLGI